MTEQYTEIIAGEKFVITALRSLMDARIVCKMEIPQTKYSWITMLLDIQSMGNSYYLLIDRVAGFESALSHVTDKEVFLEFREKGGVPCTFNTRVVECRPKDLLSELPKAIHRIQRRQYFRIEARLGTEMTFRIGSSEEKEKAKVKNFSAGGVAFFVEKDLKFSVGDQLNDICLDVPKEPKWVSFHTSKAVVRRIEDPSLHGGRFLCAIEFLEVTRETRNNLTSYIFREQRVWIQKLRR